MKLEELCHVEDNDPMFSLTCRSEEVSDIDVGSRIEDLGS